MGKKRKPKSNKAKATASGGKTSAAGETQTATPSSPGGPALDHVARKSSVEEAEKKGELDWPEDKKAQERLLSAIKLKTLAPFLFGQKTLSLEVGGVRGCGLIM
jgi:hypothetical protein